MNQEKSKQEVLRQEEMVVAEILEEETRLKLPTSQGFVGQVVGWRIDASRGGIV